MNTVPNSVPACPDLLLLLSIQVLGAGHPDTLASLSNLASCLRDHKRQREAYILHQSVLAMRTEALGAEHPHTVASMAATAACLKDLRHHALAELLYRNALELRSRMLGMQHNDTIASMNNLAICLNTQVGFFLHLVPLCMLSLCTWFAYPHWLPGMPALHV